MRKSNVLLIGSPGSGKTLLAESLARYLHVPFSAVDATALAVFRPSTEAELFRDLLSEAGGVVGRAQYGIVCIQNLHALAKKDTQSDALYVANAQHTLSAILAGDYIEVPTRGDLLGAQTDRLDTRNILFVCEGSFPDIETKVRDRLPHKAQLTKSDIVSRIEPRDLVAYGLSQELVGTFGFIITLDELRIEDLVAVLSRQTTAGGLAYLRTIADKQISVQFTEEGYRTIAALAQDRASGALGLESVLADLFLFISSECRPGDPVEVNADFVSRSVSWRNQRRLPVSVDDFRVSQRYGVIIERNSGTAPRRIFVLRYADSSAEDSSVVIPLLSEIVDQPGFGFVGVAAENASVSTVVDALPYAPLRSIVSAVLPVLSKLRVPVVGVGDPSKLRLVIREKSVLESQATFIAESTSRLRSALLYLEEHFPVPLTIQTLNKLIQLTQNNAIDPLQCLTALDEVVSELAIEIPSRKCPSLYK